MSANAFELDLETSFQINRILSENPKIIPQFIACLNKLTYTIMSGSARQDIFFDLRMGRMNKNDAAYNIFSTFTLDLYNKHFRDCKQKIAQQFSLPEDCIQQNVEFSPVLMADIYTELKRLKEADNNEVFNLDNVFKTAAEHLAVIYNGSREYNGQNEFYTPINPIWDNKAERYNYHITSEDHDVLNNMLMNRLNGKQPTAKFLMFISQCLITNAQYPQAEISVRFFDDKYTRSMLIYLNQNFDICALAHKMQFFTYLDGERPILDEWRMYVNPWQVTDLKLHFERLEEDIQSGRYRSVNGCTFNINSEDNATLEEKKLSSAAPELNMQLPERHCLDSLDYDGCLNPGQDTSRVSRFKHFFTGASLPHIFKRDHYEQFHESFFQQTRAHMMQEWNAHLINTVPYLKALVKSELTKVASSEAEADLDIIPFTPLRNTLGQGPAALQPAQSKITEDNEAETGVINPRNKRQNMSF